MRSSVGKNGNCITSKDDFVKEKITEKILGKIICYEFVKSLSYTFQPNYLPN